MALACWGEICIKEKKSMKPLRRRGARLAHSSLLSLQHLRGAECVSLQASSESHAKAKLRVNQADLESLRHRTPARFAGLFSAHDSGEAVSLRLEETLRVQLPPVGPASAEVRELVVVSHSAYTRGGRVPGVVHRALVSLEWE